MRHAEDGSIIDVHRHAGENLGHSREETTPGELTTPIAHDAGQPLSALVTIAGACVWRLAIDPPSVMTEAQAPLESIIANGRRARDEA